MEDMIAYTLLEDHMYAFCWKVWEGFMDDEPKILVHH